MKRLFLILLLFLSLFFPGCAVDSPANQAFPEGDSYFQVHFLDVGQADSALVICDGKTMLIDGGNVADSSYLVAYLEKLGISYLDYIVCSHAHEDHVGGLSGPLNTCQAGQVMAPVSTYESKAFGDFAKYAEKQGLEIIIPELGQEFALSSSQVKIIGPSAEYKDPNNTSIVLRIVYGSTSFLFTGDAERESEQDMLDYGLELKSTLLKVGHHGSDSSTTYPFLREVMPEYAVISVGEGNSYGHPTEQVLSRLFDAGVTVYRTDQMGEIIVKSDGERLSFETARQVQPLPGRSGQPEVLDGQGQVRGEDSCIGNLNSKVFHRPACASLPAEENRIYFAARETAIQDNYKPCGRCQP